MIVDVKQFNQERINNCILTLPLKRVLQLEVDTRLIACVSARLLFTPFSLRLTEITQVQDPLKLNTECHGLQYDYLGMFFHSNFLL